MTYFDNAATSNFKPKEVINACKKALVETSGNPGRGAHRVSLDAGRALFNARENISQFFNCPTDNLIFTANATEALNVGILGKLKSGDHVITTVAEHNSVYRPLGYLKTLGIEVTQADSTEDGFTSAENIEKEIRSNTKLIIVNHQSNVTGVIQPVNEIGEMAKTKGIFLLVDGAQSVGHMELDLKRMPVDLYVGTGHKALFGPQGTGFFYIKDGNSVKPLLHGGTGSESDSEMQPYILPDKFESGTPNLPGILGLSAGIDFVKANQLDEIIKKENELREFFVKELVELSQTRGIKLIGNTVGHSYGPVCSVLVSGMDSSELSYKLDSEYNIMTRPGLHCAPCIHKRMGTLESGTVRFSFNFKNSFSEIEKAIQALSKISSGK